MTRCAHCHQPIHGLRWLIPRGFLCDHCWHQRTHDTNPPPPQPERNQR